MATKSTKDTEVNSEEDILAYVCSGQADII